MNSHSNSCAQPSGSSNARRSSSMSTGSPMRTASWMVTRWHDQRDFSGTSRPPLPKCFSHSFQSTPCFPLGVVMRRTFFSPPRSGLVMEGSTARQVASGFSKKANSVRSRLAEKPRTVSGRPGTHTMRLLLPNSTVVDFSSVPAPPSRRSRRSVIANS